MAVSVITPTEQLLTNSGAPLSGGKVYVYAHGTTTPLDLFADDGLSVPTENPIILDSAGRPEVGMVYIATATYKIVVKTSAGVTIYTRDDIDPGVPIGTGALGIVNGGTGADSAEEALVNLGGASNETVSDLAAQIASFAGAQGSTAKTHIATGTVAQRDASPAQGDIQFTTDVGGFGTQANFDGTNWRKVSYTDPAAGTARNITIDNNAGTPNTQIDIACDAIVVETSAGEAYRLRSVSVTINAAGTGANGLDAGTLGNSTWYYHYIIYNPTTLAVAGLTSTSSSSPTLPSGYTAKARVGTGRTDGSAHFLRIRIRGRKFQYLIGTNPTVIPNIASGTAGTYSATSPTLATASISGVVPPIATVINILAVASWENGSSSNILVAPNTSYGGINNGPQGSNGQMYPIWLRGSAADSNDINDSTQIVLETTSVAWASSAAGGALGCIGWEENV